MAFDVARHLDALEAELRRFESSTPRVGREAFLQDQRRRLAAAIPDEATREAYEQAVPEEHVWLGLERYWTRRDEAAA